MHLRTIREVKKLAGKRVLVRADFNVPVKRGKIQDDYKIQKALATIVYLIKQGAQIILLSHLGMLRQNDPVASLRPVGRYLEKLLKKKVRFIPLQPGVRPRFERLQFPLKNGEVALLENVRFSPDEMTNSGTFARELANLADIFVLDGFASAHRATASVSGVARFLPAHAGLLLAEELQALEHVLARPRRPMVIVLGGAKLETKLPIITHLLPKAETLLLGGSIAASFLAAQGWAVGNSAVERQQFSVLKKLARDKKVLLPVDVVVGGPRGERAHVVEVEKSMRVGKGEAIYDIGPRTIARYAQEIKRAQTIVWNGAVGLFEQHPYEFGTKAIAELLARRARGPAFVICGGGETVETVRTWGLEGSFDLVSTGGGALLEFLGGKKLPGIAAVEKK